MIAFILGLYLAFVVASGAVSLVDDTCAGLWGVHALTSISGIIAVLTILGAVLVYGLMALTPMVPKRIFLPAVLVMLGQFLVALPWLIFFYDRVILLDWLLSGVMVGCGLVLARKLRGDWKFRWPLVVDKDLRPRGFSWSNLVLFMLLNLFVLLPLVAAYVAGCASLAVSHFTNGFVRLRPAGIILQARKYVRPDGRTVILFPMSHIAEPEFYRSVAGTVGSNSVVLLEGVTDTRNLLTNKLSYRRAAKALHLAEQHDDFHLQQGKLVPADVDVQVFSSHTIAVLNLMALVHSQGLNAHTLSLLLKFQPSEDTERQLWEDLLVKRNSHLLQEFYSRLPESDSFIIPWGAAHMPGLSQEIQKAGFRLAETRDYISVRFGSRKRKGDSPPGWIPSKAGADARTTFLVETAKPETLSRLEGPARPAWQGRLAPARSAR